MGVFKWLRRERVTVTTTTTHRTPSPGPTPPDHAQSVTEVGTIRTEEYKRDLAEFQARRSSGVKELPETPIKKKCGRHSLPISCTDCATDPDQTFNYDKKSATKYKKRTQKRARSANPDDKQPVPNIQFLFQNQVFMPGNLPASAFSEPQRPKRYTRKTVYRSPDNFAQKQIDFKDDEHQLNSPPFAYKNNSLPYDEQNFQDSRSDIEEVDGIKAAGDANVSSHSSSGETSKDGSEDKLWEVMSELKNFDQWADEQLRVQSANISKTGDSKSEETSAYGLSLASASNLDVNLDRARVWSHGRWGVVPVQIKALDGVTVGHVRRKLNTEVNILRKCRHPNIILLMGIYPDVHNNINIICERCVDTLHDILHAQGRILSAQTSVQYALDIANALVFLRMQGYIHTALNSKSIMITRHDTAKLSDLGPCVTLPKERKKEKKGYVMYSPEPQYVNIEDTRENSQESEPLISQHASEAYMTANAVSKDYKLYLNSENYRWHAPELFEPDDGMVYPCGKSDVYSLCLVLWESCNAKLPWDTLSYEKLREQYTLWKAGQHLPRDGTYPGCLLALLQDGLKLDRSARIDLEKLQNILQTVKHDLDQIDYIIIPARLSKNKSDFSNVGWDTSPTDSECLSPPQPAKHKAVVHAKDSSTESDKDCSQSESPIYETIPQQKSFATFAVPEKCYVSDDECAETRPILKYQHLPDKDFSSACSTPIAKIRARINYIGTPALHKSDSTEYCSLYSPNNRTRNFTGTDDSVKDVNSTERPVAKLSRSFTPQSYKPLHIKVPEYNLNCIRSLPKDNNGGGRSSYNFDIKNYSLPTTPIARSNKLRKNAWLSGECVAENNAENIIKDAINKLANKEISVPNNTYETTNSTNNRSQEKDCVSPLDYCPPANSKEETSPESVDTLRDSFTGLKRTHPPEDFNSPETDTSRERSNSWSFKSPLNDKTKYKPGDDALANVNIKPLVAIHEKWIYEANRKTGRSMSLPENNRNQTAAVKPASHCVDTLQKSLPQLNARKPGCFKTRSPSPASENGGQWEQFCQARDNIAKKINFAARDPERFHTWRKDAEKGTITDENLRRSEAKVDQATDTRGIEEFIRELIRKEFQHIFHELQDDTSTSSHRTDELVNKGIANIMENLNNNNEEHQKIPVKSFSRVKINGNNKPLLQITFSRCGENSLQVLDNCVNVTICESSPGKDKNQSMEDTLTEDVQVNALKRCQAFNALQEARSTEDLYIDDELSTQMHDNFGKMRLIPLHGSLHEILCEKEDDCCLIKVKQENGCDTIYFRCDHSDTESRDAIDGCVQDMPQDTVVFKRSISLVEERIQRIFPSDKRVLSPAARRRKEVTKIRPKSEIFVKNIKDEKRFLSNSSPSLTMQDDAVELNIENVLAYQDSSSDECLKCQTDNDDFEFIERKIEEDLAISNISNLSSLTCGCLEKISEENLSVVNEDTTDKGSSSDPGI